MGNFLKISFWFDITPDPYTLKVFWGLIVIFALAIILGSASLFFLKKYQDNKLVKKVWSKFMSWGYSAGLIGLLLIFFRQQKAPYFGMRIIMALWLAVVAVWLFFILKFWLLEVPKIKKEQQRKEELRKYLP